MTRWTVKEKNEMLEKYKQGVDIEILSKEYNRSPSAIRQQASLGHTYRTREALAKIRKKAAGHGD